MQQKRIVGMVCAGAVCAAVLMAAEPWKSKESAQWTDDDINKVLTDSPWAKEKTVSPQRQQPYGGRGMGRRSGGMGGGGYPGGGGGYPGGGGGYPSGGGGNPSESSMNLTIRWDSALPVQQALKRQGVASAEEVKTVSEASEKYYVIAVFGFHMPTNRRSYNSSDDSDQDRSSSTDRMRTQLLDAAQLEPKGGRALYAQDVQIEGGGSEIHFLFPRNPGLASTTKEVDFILQIRDIKVEQKFHFSDMQYQGQLAL
jgi:hypothetical protein